MDTVIIHIQNINSEHKGLLNFMILELKTEIQKVEAERALSLRLVWSSQ